MTGARRCAAPGNRACPVCRLRLTSWPLGNRLTVVGDVHTGWMSGAGTPARGRGLGADLVIVDEPFGVEEERDG